MKLMLVMGTRPHFIKFAPLLRTIGVHNDLFPVLVHTGQHYDEVMSGVFLKELGFPSVDYNLGVGSGTHGIQTGKMLQELDLVLLKEKPDLVVVAGDTNTTLAGALAAYKLHIPVAHIESGMREYIWRPEEMNKIVSDHCADFCFCSIRKGVDNLKKENIPESRIFFTGDITFDAFMQNVKKAQKEVDIKRKYGVKAGEYVLLTMHRAETVDHLQRVRGIIEALLKLQIIIVFPLHPRTSRNLEKLGLLELLERASHLNLIGPVGYWEFLSLMSASRMVITDSSGVLKEAFYALKPCVTLDETSEYMELVELGYNKLVGFETAEILGGVESMINKVLAPLSFEESPFGDGTAAKRMIDIILSRQPSCPEGLLEYEKMLGG